MVAVLGSNVQGKKKGVVGSGLVSGSTPFKGAHIVAN